MKWVCQSWWEMIAGYGKANLDSGEKFIPPYCAQKNSCGTQKWEIDLLSMRVVCTRLTFFFLLLYQNDQKIESYFPQPPRKWFSLLCLGTLVCCETTTQRVTYQVGQFGEFEGGQKQCQLFGLALYACTNAEVLKLEHHDDPARWPFSAFFRGRGRQRQQCHCAVVGVERFFHPYQR